MSATPPGPAGGESPEPAGFIERRRRRSTDRSVVSVRTLVVAGLLILSVVALVFILSGLVSILLVILVAIVFAEGIRPLVKYLTGTRHWPEPLAIVSVYVVLLGVLAGFGALLVTPIVSEATALAKNFPTYQRQFLDFYKQLENQFHFSANINQYVTGALGTAQQVLITIGATIVSIVINFVLVLVVGFMWLVSTDRLKAFVVDLFPPQHQALASDVIREVGVRMGGFLRATALNGLAVGAATGLASWILGLPSPVLLGVFSGLIALIPVVGAIGGVIPPTLIAFTISPVYPIVVLVVMLVIQLIDANTVVPVVMNRVVALPALAVVLALVVGGALAGVIGALLAVPVAAAIQVLVLRVLVPAIHHAQGRPNPIWNDHPEPAPAKGPGRRAAALRWVPRLKRP